ncbi:MAG: helix-turn-helix transcriptional regulator [Armatimonadota bacterium]|nr:helix-turn-helix transcriptional regulator [Armatimonadota bacterium]MDR7400741.1 helix-turn-helix transcriptional regulator [Armatimonadota bacterium]MDR7436448.1 helix-turn-helix transcriptional regulator [Armatimonadota bacterium]MDR7472483.1 helix-turn-helix transcriptional regulator [Armatimonadota bacterium]MDR7505985.1 helix-turn-helix transcriptional regulator [Armatimonadota bacterium]
MPDTAPRRASRSRLDFGRAIETLRTSRGLSREELARLARISRSYLHEVERGLKRPSADILARLARALGVGSAALMQYVEEISAPPDDDRLVAVQLPLRGGRPLPLFEPGGSGGRDSGSPDREALVVAELLVIARRLSPADRAALLALARHLLLRSSREKG